MSHTWKRNRSVACRSDRSQLPDVSKIPVPMPYQLRSERDRRSVVELRGLRRHVCAGLTVWAALGKLPSSPLAWHVRLSLLSATAPHGHAPTSTLADWDEAPGRTQKERVSLVDRALYLLGDYTRHGGGWRVSSGVSRA